MLIVSRFRFAFHAIVWASCGLFLLIVLLGLPDGCSAAPATTTKLKTTTKKLVTTTKRITSSTKTKTTTTKAKTTTTKGKSTTTKKATSTTTKKATSTTTKKATSTKTTTTVKTATTAPISSSSVFASSSSSSVVATTTLSSASASPSPSQCLSTPRQFSSSKNMTRIMRTRSGSSNAKSSGFAALPMIYQWGAPVMTNTVPIYMIYYGNWAADAIDLTNSFVSGLSSTPWNGINQRYYYAASSSSPKTYVTNFVLGGMVKDAYSLGTTLVGDAVRNIVQRQLNLGTFAVDTDALYIVAVSKDVTESYGSGSNLCGAYCGYHSYADLPCSGSRIKYSLVADTDQCSFACNPQAITPNGIPGVDGMLSVLAHEIVEAVSDPELNAWYDANGYENADKCSWTYGNTELDSNGSQYNINFGGRNYFIQQNWNLDTNACAMSA